MMIDRAVAARFALENTRIEGLSVSQETLFVIERWAAGDITDDELIGEIQKQANCS